MSAQLRRHVPRPIFRKLRVFAIDPGMTARFETAVLNEMTLSIPWEDLEPGPVGEYVAVIDVDQNGNLVHEPVDINRPDIIAQNGLAPSDGNPHFRQQMVYAVAMRTINNFERALGRTVHWPLENSEKTKKRGTAENYQRRLPMHPHYMTEANAYYDLAGKFCFGYFRSKLDSPLSGTTVFTCLSQDIIAHELTHAILAGMEISFYGYHPDVLALHEGFSDLISLLQHFWLSDVLRHQITLIRGQLNERSPLGTIAPQFGQAVGRLDGLRDALGSTDRETKEWRARMPDPMAYATATEPHDRGDILVGAIFDAFNKIYESRVSDLRRIATKGTGVLPAGNLHPDLVNRFAREASRTAQSILEMCIRALDFCPPVEITFGDFLRALVTADYDVAPAEEVNFRIAFVDSFRRNGILPENIGTLSLETLLWPQPSKEDDAEVISAFVRTISRELTPWNLPHDRKELWALIESKRLALHAWLKAKSDRQLGPINFAKPFKVQSFNPREHGMRDGKLVFQWVAKLAQGRAGVTLVVDGDTGRVRYQIDKAPPPAKAKKDEPRPPATGVPTTRRPPAERSLRVFAFDPSLGTQLDTAAINEVTIRVPWERGENGIEMLKPGPVGEYLEVVDHDPASGCYYDPVDLNDPLILAQDGLPPSESNPQFHQQMVYAVAMRTIRNFERALGRLALWRSHPMQGESGSEHSETYVQRLRIYPHALREANAYYSPEKKAVLFGYFQADAEENQGSSSGVTVFTCLSHDIIAHEVSHALLDGMHRHFSEPSNLDVLAFHEAFADLVALLQHFSLPEVLHHQISSTRGDLASQNRLGELAQQFGQAIGKRGALRNAIGKTDLKGQWQRNDADPGDYRKYREPHDRGAVLVAAVFDAFLSIYKARIADLLRIASEGTGVLPAGNLHPDLTNRLTNEAADSARHVLEMCIRALDYCPPVDITFGDYLRAIVTADFEYDPIDEEKRRVAFAESFRRRGIVAESVQSFSTDGLLWRPTSAAPDEDESIVMDIVKHWAADITSWGLSRNRETLHELMTMRRAELRRYLLEKITRQSISLAGIDPLLDVEVHSLRPSMRMNWQNKPTFQWIIELTQRIPQYFDDSSETQDRDEPDYYLRGGCTLLVDAESGKVRYSIKKKITEARKERQRRFAMDESNLTLASTYFGRMGAEDNEPFAMLHRH